MMISGRNLAKLPVYTSDLVKYSYVTALLDSDQSSIQQILIQDRAFFETNEFVIPHSQIKVIHPKHGIYLLMDDEEVQETVRRNIYLGSYLRRDQEAYSDTIVYNDMMSLLSPEIGVEDSARNIFSTEDLLNCRVECVDAELGPVYDFFMNSETLTIPYVAVKIKKTFGSTLVVLAIDWFEKMSLAQGKIFMNDFKEHIKSGPAYDAKQGLSLDYEQKLNDYYSDMDQMYT